MAAAGDDDDVRRFTRRGGGRIEMSREKRSSAQGIINIPQGRRRSSWEYFET